MMQKFYLLFLMLFLHSFVYELPAQLIKINQSKDKYEPNTPYLMIQEGHASSIVSINFTTKGDQLLTFASGQYKLWDAFTGKLVWEVNIDPTRDYTSITPDGKFRVSSNKGGTSRVEEILGKDNNNDLITKRIARNENSLFDNPFANLYKDLLNKLFSPVTNFDETYYVPEISFLQEYLNKNSRGEIQDKKPYKIFRTIEYKLLTRGLFKPVQTTSKSYQQYADSLVKEIIINKNKYSPEEIDYIKKRSDYYRNTKPKKGEDEASMKPYFELSVKPAILSNNLKTGILIGDAGLSVGLWDLERDELITTISEVDEETTKTILEEGGVASVLAEKYKVCYSPDSKYIAFVQNNLGYNNADFEINIWGVEQKKILRKFTIPNLGNENFTFSGDKKFMISGDLSNYLKIWDFRKGKIIDAFDEYVGMQEDPESKGAYLTRNFYKKQQFALGLKNDVGNVLDTYKAAKEATFALFSLNIRGVFKNLEKLSERKDKDTRNKTTEDIIDILNLKPKLERMLYGANMFRNPLNMVSIEGNNKRYAIETPDKKIIIYNLEASLEKKNTDVEIPRVNKAEAKFDSVGKRVETVRQTAEAIQERGKELGEKVGKITEQGEKVQKISEDIQKTYTSFKLTNIKQSVKEVRKAKDDLLDTAKETEEIAKDLQETAKSINAKNLITYNPEVDNSPKFDFLRIAGRKLGVFRQNFIDEFKIIELDTDGMRGINRDGFFVSELNQFITWGNDRFVTVWDLESQRPVAKFGSKLIQKNPKEAKKKSEKEIELEKLQKIIDDLKKEYEQTKSQYKASKDKALKDKYQDLENQIKIMEAEYKIVKKAKPAKTNKPLAAVVLDKLTNTTRIVHQVALASDNKTAAFMYDDEELSIWDLEPKEKEAKPSKEKSTTKSDKKQPEKESEKEGKQPKLKPLEKPILNLGIQEGITDFVFTKDGKYLITVGEDRKVEFWNVQTGKVEKSYNIKGSRITLLPKGERAMVGNKIWRLSDGTVEKTLKDFQQDLNKIYFDDEETVLLCGRQIWDVDSAKLKCFIHTVRGTSDYIIYNQEGYYKSTRGGAETLHFIHNGKVYQFDQFDLQFNRPDLVLNSIGVMPQEVTDAYYKAYLKRVRRLGLDPDSFDKDLVFNAPEIKRLGDASKFFASKVRKFNFAVEMKDDKYKLDRVNVNVNGVPVFGLLGKSLKDLNTNSVQQSFEIDLNEGKNIIQVYAMNEKGVESLKERFEVDYIPAEGEKTSRTLYLITMGVTNYDDSWSKIELSVNDVEAISSQFAKGKFFDNVKIIKLINDDVSMDTLIGLRPMLEQTKVDDYVIVAFAGHGAIAGVDYYLGTSKTNAFKLQENGIYYEDLMSLLDEIPARQKVLFLDACHSGEVDKEEANIAETAGDTSIVFDGTGEMSEMSEIQTPANSGLGLGNSFELMQELFTDLQKNTGTTVISAAKASESSKENPNKKNSEFTTVLLRAITQFDTYTITENDQEIEKKFLKADADGDGIVMLSELMKYIIKEVSKESKGTQQPTSRVENIVYDFPIW